MWNSEQVWLKHLQDGKELRVATRAVSPIRLVWDPSGYVGSWHAQYILLQRSIGKETEAKKTWTKPSDSTHCFSIPSMVGVGDSAGFRATAVL